MKKILSILFILVAVGAQAQFSKASLQASGLTCSMCSKAVKKALEEVPFVKGVQVDIKNQQYNLTFKEDNKGDFDVLQKAVEDAGFSVANLTVTADVQKIAVEKDKHIKIGSQYFHFLNIDNRPLTGTTTLTIVDKGFVPVKDFKKWSSVSKMGCVQTGKAAGCCAKDDVPAQARIYHVII